MNNSQDKGNKEFEIYMSERYILKYFCLGYSPEQILRTGSGYLIYKHANIKAILRVINKALKDGRK